MFGLAKLKKNSGLSIKKLKALESEVRRDYPDDPLMFELHLLRALKRGVRRSSQRSTRMNRT